MEPENEPAAAEDLNQETRAIWEAKATWWAERIGEGNEFQLEIVNPPTERLLALRPGESVLDIACGGGPFSRRMARAGAHVVAFDFSEQFVAWARAHSTGEAIPIEYHVLDATDAEQLLMLGERRFDAAVCNMALMDIPTITPLLSALSRLLKVGGRFVFSIPHPCFSSNAVQFTAEEEDRGGTLVATYGVKMDDYLHVPPGKGVGIMGEPRPHYYFHRPLGILFGACFHAGFVLDGLEEPADPGAPDPTRPFSSQNRPGIPPALVARVRLLA